MKNKGYEYFEGQRRCIMGNVEVAYALEKCLFIILLIACMTSTH